MSGSLQAQNPFDDKRRDLSLSRFSSSLDTLMPLNKPLTFSATIRDGRMMPMPFAYSSHNPLRVPFFKPALNPATLRD
ncbi:hypothetical protein [Bifidobacterium sp. SO1]|uniref:hypothetical protein n=1 Tax=Bifidobacterium sp. SO1 TaxID=2809029 RepID=UPI001F0ACF5A|nr:hypothetical protein [Bifidobacterium sp. SO1]